LIQRGRIGGRSSRALPPFPPGPGSARGRSLPFGPALRRAEGQEGTPGGRCSRLGSNEKGEAAMIPRYSRPQMAAIWSPETRYRIWFEIEAHAADALAELGVIPREAAETLWEKGRDAVFDAARIEEIERE